MLNENLAVKKSTFVNKDTKTENPIEVIRARRSNELVIGVCGAIGSGTKELAKELLHSLRDNGYETEYIKVSELIFKIRNDPTLSSLKGFEKYNRYQVAGNEIREQMGVSYLAEAAIKDIYVERGSHKEEGDDPDDPRITKKVAYVVDQLKHPSEVALFKAVYPNNFYMIGINSNEEARKRYLENNSITSEQANKLIEVDRKDPLKHGQQVEATFFKSDYFIHNKQNAESVKIAVKRFIDLVHGVNGKTPSKDERGMYEAFSASLQSACLSRQVGAAIMNKKGDILSTGCNDVPAYGGGLYNAEHGKSDLRCIFKGQQCYNDLHKNLLQNQFEDILKKSGVAQAAEIAKELLKSSKAKDIIEYSRAIHAEMAAIVQLARTPAESSSGTTLYCTTYPCHNCARHVVAAGISRVVYVEPYEKSLALKLHDDTITHTGEENKVKFEPFEGVSPERYLKFFKITGRKDDSGQAVIKRPADSHHVDPQYLDSYPDYEEKIIELFNKKDNPFTAQA